jgi:alkylated DNA nucleotide flippase Atl1
VILDVVASIPRGRVSTYGVVADARGVLPRNARLVGRVLSKLPAGSRCAVAPRAGCRRPHRISGGYRHRTSGSASDLLAEGVVVLRGRVDIERHGWSTPQDDLDRWLWAPARGPAPRRARRRRMIDAFGNRRGGS